MPVNKKAVGALFGRFIEGLAVGAAEKHIGEQELIQQRKQQAINTALNKATDPNTHPQEAYQYRRMYKQLTGYDLPANRSYQEQQEMQPGPEEFTDPMFDYLDKVGKAADIEKTAAQADAQRALASQRRKKDTYAGDPDEDLKLRLRFLADESDNLRRQLTNMVQKNPITGELVYVDRERYDEIRGQLDKINREYSRLYIEAYPDTQRRATLPGWGDIPTPEILLPRSP